MSSGTVFRLKKIKIRKNENEVIEPEKDEIIDLWGVPINLPTIGDDFIMDIGNGNMVTTGKLESIENLNGGNKLIKTKNDYFLLILLLLFYKVQCSSQSTRIRIISVIDDSTTLNALQHLKAH